MREDLAYAMEQAIGLGDVAALSELLAADPRMTGTPIPVNRDWGQEMWLGLHLAAEGGQVELVRLLIQAGASVDARTRFRTPMHARETALLIAARKGQELVVELLLKAHADPGLLDANHRSALSYVAEAGHTSVLRLLLSYGVEVDPADDHQRTPLHWAIAGNQPSAAMMLIDAGADPNHCCPKDPAGYTPLHRCVSIGNAMQTIARRLIEKGADRSLADPRHQLTADDLARQLGLAIDTSPIKK